MFPIATMGGISSLMQAISGMSKMGGMGGLGGMSGAPTAANAGSAGKGFSFMDAAGSAMGKMPAGGGGKNPHLMIDPGYGLRQYQDMSQPNISPLFNMMNSLQQQQQPQKQPMQMPMHPLVLQMLRIAGVQ